MPGDEVVGAVAGRGVHGAGPRFERDVVAEHADGRPRVERMLEADVFQLRRPSFARSARRTCARSTAATEGASASATMHGAAADVVGGVVELRMKRDRQVRRNRPGRRRPDQHRDVAARELRDAAAQLSARCRPRAGTRRRSRARCDPRTRLRPRPAPCGSGCTSARASCPCTPGPSPTNLPSARAMAAWYLNAIVRYGCSQSPKTPSRLNSPVITSMNRSA